MPPLETPREWTNKPRTFTDEEVMDSFNKIIDKVVSSHNAELRDK